MEADFFSEMVYNFPFLHYTLLKNLVFFNETDKGKMMEKNNFNRRIFLMGTAAAGLAGCAAPRLRSLKSRGFRSPNEMLQIASCGAGGKAQSDIQGCKTQHLVAISDPDWITSGVRQTFEAFPKAKKYKDYRKMMDENANDIDAVIVSTPDHHHAVASMRAIKMGKHVFCQKPLTHNVFEARAITEAAKEYGVATQMGNQGHSGEGVRRICETVWSGLIGDVREVHAWTNRPIWPQGLSEPLPAEEIPEEMAWDTWLGPAPYRPYNPGYAPFKWRGWLDYGTGSLGDMACHILDPANWALQLTNPTSVECISIEGHNSQTYPNKSIVRFEFPQRGAFPPLTLYWYDGGNLPELPAGMSEGDTLGDAPRRRRNGDNRPARKIASNGSFFVGDKGIITQGTYGGNPRLVPGEMNEAMKGVEQYLTRSPGHYRDWIRACKGGAPACSNFSYAGPFTEWIVMACIAQRLPHQKLNWDAKKLVFTNSKEATQYVSRDYRKGWGLV